MKNIIFILLLISNIIYGQIIPPAENIPAHINNFSFQDRVSKSDLIVEGMVISTSSFFGPKGNVFTSVIIRVAKIFSGDLKDTVVELIMEGGTIPSGAYKGAKVYIEDGCCALLYKGTDGMFFLRSNRSDIQSGEKIQSFFYLQGASIFYYHHDVVNPPATGVYGSYNDLEKELYEPIEAITHIPRKVLALNLFEIADSIDPENWTLKNKVKKSGAVVEGTIINKTKIDGGPLLDSNKVCYSIIIRVSRIFKGDITDTIIELITDEVNPSKYKPVKGKPGNVSLAKGMEGLFFLQANNTKNQSTKGVESFRYLTDNSFMFYIHSANFPITYDKNKRYDSLEKDLYPAIEAATGIPPKIISQNSFEIEAEKKQQK